MRDDFEKLKQDTDRAIEAHERALEDKEKRLRVLEVPIEDNGARFEKIEAQTHALKYPIKDIYARLDELERGKTADTESFAKQTTTFEQRMAKLEQLI